MLDQRVRNLGIGGSEVAAILGLDSRGDAFSVWLEKQGLSEREDPSPLMVLGKLLEQGIAQYYSQITGRPIQWIDETQTHPTRPWMIYTIDALCLDEPRGLDAKLVLGNRYEWGDEATAVPLRVELQARWYMAALDYPVWDIMAVVGAEPRTYTIQRDLEIEGEVLAAAEAFYRRHLLTGVPPEPGSSEATTRYLKERYRNHGTVIRSASPAESDLLDLYAIARREFEEAEDNKQKLTNQLCQAIGDDIGIRSDHCTLTWKRIKDSEIVDWHGLADFLLDANNYPPEERDRLIMDRTFPKPGYRRIHFTDRRKD